MKPGALRLKGPEPGGRKRGGVFCGLVLAAALAAFLASCATAPKTSFPAEGENAFSLLPSGGKVYLWADAVRARPLIDALSFEGKSGKDAAAVLDRTESAVAAFFPEGGERRFYLAASGRYPRGRANLSFAFSGAWKKRKSETGNSFWHSGNGNVALALGSNLALVSDGDPFGDFAGELPPEGFADFRRGQALAGWLNNASESVNGFLANLGVPLQIPAEALFFGAARMPAAIKANGTGPEGITGPEGPPAAGTGGGLWALSFNIKTPSANHARSLLALFSAARRFMGEGALPAEYGEDSLNPQAAAALLFAKAPEQDGAFLRFRVDSLDEGRIALLFGMFSIY